MDQFGLEIKTQQMDRLTEKFPSNWLRTMNYSHEKNKFNALHLREETYVKLVYCKATHNC